MSTVSVERVKAFWETEACGERYGAEQDSHRYELEPEILTFADFGSAAGDRVLEIGVGMGADFLRWARAGAYATGIDLTERAVRLAQNRLCDEGLRANLCTADAENLPFKEGTFDIVYSWGVLHHTPSPARALAEAQRVLAPGGQLKIMLYHRRSWVALASWIRFGLLRGKPWATHKHAIAHVESPGTQAFTIGEVCDMLPGMVELNAEAHLTHWDRKYAPILSRLTGHRYGWFLLVKASAPMPKEGHS